MYEVYVLESISTGKHYTGHTENLSNRIEQHNSGILNHYTKSRDPWKLIYHEEFETRSEAMKREKYLKTGAGRDFLRTPLKEK